MYWFYNAFFIYFINKFQQQRPLNDELAKCNTENKVNNFILIQLKVLFTVIDWTSLYVVKIELFRVRLLIEIQNQDFQSDDFFLISAYEL